MLFLTVLWVTCAQAKQTPAQSPETSSPLLHRLLAKESFSVVQTTDDIPEGACRFVKDYPLPIDHMKLPEPKLMCKTLNAVIIDDMVDTH